MSPRISLRDVDTRALQRELAARSRCVDCSTQHASGWISLDGNRIRCAGCEELRTGPRVRVERLIVVDRTAACSAATGECAATAAKGAKTC